MKPTASLHLPWREAGLTERQAAAHLLDRFAFGARPGAIDGMIAMGVETWFERQLEGGLPDPRVAAAVSPLSGLRLNNLEITETYPGPGRVLREAMREGVIEEDSAILGEHDGAPAGARVDGRKVLEYARQKGYRRLRELIGELMAQKLYRAVLSENQLHEVLTDFWFNHFNVSVDDECRAFVVTYERDAIRPHVVGRFQALLEATARHPAMLLYLDNARSVAGEGAPTLIDLDHLHRRYGRRRYGRRRARGGRRRAGDPAAVMGPELRRAFEQNRPRGLNENYARELLELHTLGVDGGYDQDDVIAVARAFTGWTTYPAGGKRREVEERLRRARFLREVGFYFDDDFVFRADAHDAGAKIILGRSFPPGRGLEEGREVLAFLASHPSTAHHLARKLAARFVADAPPEALAERLAGVYLESGGDLDRMLRALVSSPEFWSAAARRQKIKSPFELAASALRALDASIDDPREILEWIGRMGQPLYSYAAPTGYPDRADHWVNTGSLLARMNFGLELATGRAAGVEFDLASLAGEREPESLTAALQVYVPLLLPERDPEPTVERLEPLVQDPGLGRKLAERTPAEERGTALDEWDGLDDRPRRRRPRERPMPPPRGVDSSPLAHVVGVILGSPEFQRR